MFLIINQIIVQRALFFRLVLNSGPATSMGLALSIQISALSWLLSTRYNLDMAQLGLVWAAGPVAGVVGQLLAGITSDKIWWMGGRRRPLIVIGGVCSSVMLYALSNLKVVGDIFFGGSVLTAAIAVTLILDISINIGLGPARALVADLTFHGDERTKGFTWLQSVSGFWGVMAYLAAGILGNDFLLLWGPLFVLIFCLSAILISENEDVYFIQEHPKPRQETGRGPPMILYAAHGVSWFGIQCMFIYTLSFVHQYLDGDSGKVLSLGFAFMSTIGFLLPALVLYRFSKTFGTLNVHIVCILLMGTGYLLIGLFARDVVTFYCLMSLVGIGWASVVSMPFAVLSEFSQGTKMGLTMGIINLSIVLPQLAASILFGNWIEHFSEKKILFYICSFSLFMSAILWVRVKKMLWKEVS